MNQRGFKILTYRLESYEEPSAKETWKLDEDLNNCTVREKEELNKYGLTVQDLMNAGWNRGQVSHALFGFRYAR